jgi:hypothetical protein
MFDLQSFDCLENLFHLIGFRASLVILNVDTRVADPGCFVDAMTCARQPRLIKCKMRFTFEVTKEQSKLAEEVKGVAFGLQKQTVKRPL